ncbi:MAG: UDP-2,4-diacetamido-2,4,6-trideoxy-beta-L-altropyranose hydrolase, partial [Candidatus Marinimicrobia bacterium]|nr:UDP-2,4-diacetamido-2,4,6-trideoxy-beta-L-altropyranose hydrolase [Candidatus Neomarinimicrobiota bacterium]
MKAIFRVDASLKMGTGHVMRCLTLAQVLNENGADVEFICRKHEGSLIDKIRSSGFVVHELEVFEETKVDNKLAHSHWLGATQQQDADDCINILKAEKLDWLIVDHYALDEEWQKRLKPCYEKLMVIDDLADKIFDCDVLLNQNLGTQIEDYKNKIPDNCELLLGCNYALLRSEFSDLRERALVRRKNTIEINNILISMGGSDNENITYDILQQLDDRFNIVVVLGSSSMHSDMIAGYAEGKKIKVIIDADNMAELMLEADLAIGAGGSTSWERCCLGLPTLLFVTAENQR